MKKSLIALAVLAASGAAMAQSSVTLYGVADIWFGSVKSQELDLVTGALVGERQTVLESGGVSGSRWGIKGSEDLGGGLKANFNLEQGIALDTGAAAGVQFNKQAYVGFSGGFGEVKLGRTGTAYDDVRGANNNTFDSALTATGLMGTFGINGVPSNGLYYATPAMGGFSAAVSYALGEDKTATNSAGSLWSLNAKYAAGPFTAIFAHQVEKGGTTFKANAFNALLELAEVDPATFVGYVGEKATYNLLSGSYDLGVVKLLAFYETAKFAVPGIDNIKAKDLQLGVDIPLSSAMTLAVGVAQGKAEAAGDEFYKTRAYSAAVAYSLSKRTTLYTGFNVNKGKSDGVTIDKGTTLAAGVKHTF